MGIRNLSFFINNFFNCSYRSFLLPKQYLKLRKNHPNATIQIALNFNDSLKALTFALFLIIINLVAIGFINFLLLLNNFKNFSYVFFLVAFTCLIAFLSRFIYNRFVLFLGFKESNLINVINK